jgi:uncharacterized protein YhaN
MCAGLLQ